MPVLKPAYKTLTETYVPPVTISLPAWRRYVAEGKNTMYGDAIIPGGTEDGGAVCSGHVCQNPRTANQCVSKQERSG